jgi:uncharacterized protein YjiS (DUF1127 family)
MTTTTLATAGAKTGTVSAALKRLLGSASRWYAERRTVTALARLDPHLLRDIGFSGEIELSDVRRRLMQP